MMETKKLKSTSEEVKLNAEKTKKETDEATEEIKGKLKKSKGSVTPEEWNTLSHKERERRFKMACMHRSSTFSFGDLIDNAIEYGIPIPTEIGDEGNFIWEGFEGMI